MENTPLILLKGMKEWPGKILISSQKKRFNKGNEKQESSSKKDPHGKGPKGRKKKTEESSSALKDD